VAFDDLWKEYPKQQKRDRALAAFAALNPPPDLAARMVASVKRWSESEQWRRDDGRYIPLLANWLKARGWEETPPCGPARSAPPRLPSAAELRERQSREKAERDAECQAEYRAAIEALPAELAPLREAMRSCPDTSGLGPIKAIEAVRGFARGEAARLGLSVTDGQVKTVADEEMLRRRDPKRPP
jgi:hypothetical protein